MLNVIVWTEGLNVSKCMRFHTKKLKFLKQYWLLKLSPTDVNKKKYKINLHRFSDPQNFKSTPAEVYHLFSLY